MVNIAPLFNTHAKKRGKYDGPDLLLMDFSTLKLTRRVMSRVLGQAYDPSGCFLNVLVASLKVLFSRVCVVTDTWDAIIDDQEIVRDILILFNHIKAKLNTLLPFPRCFKVLGTIYKKIVGMSDGSLYMARYTLHLISGPPGTDTMNISILIGAAPR